MHADLLGRLADVAAATAQGFGQEATFQFMHGRVADLLFEFLEFLPVGGQLADIGPQRRLADFRRKMPGLDPVGIAEDGHPLHDIAQLAHVARPGVAFHPSHGLGREPLERHVVLFAETFQKSRRQ